ncbi:DUF4183 domain-containing protein [Clostridiaceae bacterium M8S5]|nr:DUF4183 domain-containing protein [Clostridiaceae bacterium M8S5]
MYKLVINPISTPTTVDPQIARYFYNLVPSDIVSGTITIPSTSFTDDCGNAVTSNLTTISPNGGYYLLIVDSVVRQSGLFTVATTGSSVVITQAKSVPIGSPITLLVNNFAPVSTSKDYIT